MENKTQTAVEWLQDEYKTSGLLIDTDFAKAKEMEKEQTERMYSKEEVIAFAQWMYDYKGDINKVEELFEQFYEKEYGKDNQPI